MNMSDSGDLNDYLFAFIVLAVNTIKNHNGGYVLSLLVLFFEKKAIRRFDCKMGAYYKRFFYFLRLISCNESEIIPSFKVNAP